eukprot:9296368-Lingulodinium_polyedra.AAC.1
MSLCMLGRVRAMDARTSGHYGAQLSLFGDLRDMLFRLHVVHHWRSMTSMRLEGCREIWLRAASLRSRHPLQLMHCRHELWISLGSSACASALRKDRRLLCVCMQ